MTESALPLASWESFYVIVGSSGAALIGLQFVVMALIADAEVESSTDTVSAFGTPTIVHLAAALLVASIMSAPWPSLGSVSVALTLCGLAGIAYVAIVIRRARRQTGYKPVFEDWLWHTLLPFVAYAVLTIAAPLVRLHAGVSLFVVAATALLLLFIGIHNAWDTVTYIVLQRRATPDTGE